MTAFEVEVAFARPDQQLIVKVPAHKGITLREAIDRSGILQHFPEIDLAVNKVGIFGKAATLDTVLQSGDRVEIYRPLIADPKESRRKRAAKSKREKKAESPD